MNDLIVPIGLPITILVVLAAGLCVISMAFSGGVKYPKVEQYSLDQQWTRGPLLLSATEISPMALPSHGTASDANGGSASGKW